MAAIFSVTQDYLVFKQVSCLIFTLKPYDVTHIHHCLKKTRMESRAHLINQ